MRLGIEGFNREEVYNLFRSPTPTRKKPPPIELGRRAQFLLLVKPPVYVPEQVFLFRTGT